MSSAEAARAVDLVALSPLMAATNGTADVGIGLVDGPVAVDHPDLAHADIRHLVSGVACSMSASSACAHGTFVAGILVGRRGSSAPAIAPGCALLVRPIFVDTFDGRDAPSASPTFVAGAIVDCVDAGARVVNLSVATEHPTTTGEPSLRRALDHAAAHDVVVVAAAGNQGSLGSSEILRHRGVIPVVSYDVRGRAMAESNVGASIGRRGVGAPGDAMVSLGVPGHPVVRSGTSFATAFVSGTVALLRSLFPEASAAEIRQAIGGPLRRRSVVPPLLSATTAYTSLAGRYPVRRRTAEFGPKALLAASSGEYALPVPPRRQPPEVEPMTTPAVEEHLTPQIQAATEPVLPALLPEAPSFVYALGRIDARYPSLAVEKEFAQVIGSYDGAGLTDREVVRSVIAERGNRYLARSLCWVLTIEGLETYLLVPRDPLDFDLLIDSYRAEPRPDDLDVVIGVRRGLAPPEMCNGLVVPVVSFDQIYSFDRTSLIESIPVPNDASDSDSLRFRSLAGGLFDQLNQLADNAGATDEHRALNYLTVRYPRIYTLATEMLERNQAFTGVEVLASRLSGARVIVDVVFSYVHRQTDVTDKQFVRVDVTEEFPFLHTGLSPFYAR